MLSLLSRAALSSDEAIMRLLLARARRLPDVDLATPFGFCYNQSARFACSPTRPAAV